MITIKQSDSPPMALSDNLTNEDLKVIKLIDAKLKNDTLLSTLLTSPSKPSRHRILERVAKPEMTMFSSKSKDSEVVSKERRAKPQW